MKNNMDNPISFQEHTQVPSTPLCSVQVLKEENDVWTDIQVSSF